MIKNINFLKRFVLFQKTLFRFCLNTEFDLESHCKLRTIIQEPERILKVFQHDTNNNFSNFTYSKMLFENALRQKKYTTNNILAQTIDKVCLYPTFQIQKKALQEFYNLLCDNIHLKSNEFLQKSLIFILHTDKNAIHSPVFIQFIKFYVKDFVQLIKVQLSVDLSEESISNGIKLLFLRVLQRGFFSRKPSYGRSLSIKYPQQVLAKLIQNKSTSSAQTLMIKKLNFEIFIELKSFYEKQMRQNLYHQKHVTLMNKFSKIMKTLSFASPLTQNQNKYLRELIMKLHLANGAMPDLKIINLYLLWKQEAYQTSIQKSQLVDQFLQKIQNKMKNLQINDKKNTDFLKQKQELIKTLVHFQVSKQTQKLFVLQIEKCLSSIFLTSNFSNLIILMNQHKQISKKLIQFQLFEQLRLDQIQQISNKFCNQSQTINLNCLKAILTRNIDQVGGKQLKIFLKVFINTKINLNQSQKQSKQFIQIQNYRQSLINFVLRYLADHHKELILKEYQTILEILFNNGEQIQKGNFIDFSSISFNDEDGNYSNAIFEQIKQYTLKIQLLLPDSLQQKIHKFYSQQTKASNSFKPLKGNSQ